MKAHIFIALARSGYHGIVNWFCKQLDGRVVFYNNINEKFRPRAIVEYGKGEVEHKVFSLENFDLEGWVELFGGYIFDNVFIVNRDPYNWIASSIENGTANKKLSDLYIKWSSGIMEYSPYFCATKSRHKMWKDYVCQSLREKNFLDRKFIDVNFNRWFSDENYRRELALKIGMKFTDKGLNDVLKFGNGSSFDRMKYKGRAQEMNVLNRWKTYEYNDKFLGYIDDDIVRLGEQYFGINIFKE